MNNVRCEICIGGADPAKHALEYIDSNIEQKRYKFFNHPFCYGFCGTGRLVSRMGQSTTFMIYQRQPIRFVKMIEPSIVGLCLWLAKESRFVIKLCFVVHVSVVSVVCRVTRRRVQGLLDVDPDNSLPLPSI